MGRSFSRGGMTGATGVFVARVLVASVVAFVSTSSMLPLTGVSRGSEKMCLSRSSVRSTALFVSSDMGWSTSMSNPPSINNHASACNYRFPAHMCLSSLRDSKARPERSERSECPVQCGRYALSESRREVVDLGPFPRRFVCTIMFFHLDSPAS